MKHTPKMKHTIDKPIAEDIFNQLNSIYRAAKRSKNYTVALRALELCLKAKNANASDKQEPTLFNIHELSNEELEKIVHTLQEKEL